MKLRAIMIVIVLFLFGQKLPAQFEGVIEMKVVDTAGDSVQTAKYRLQIQGTNVSADFHESDASTMNGRFIFRSDKKVLWIIDDDQKNYIELSTDQSQSGETNKQSRKESTAEHLQKTGHKQTILGYSCEELTTQKNGDEIHVWATKQLGNIYEGLSQSLGEMNGKDEEGGWEHELGVLKMFPLKVTTIRNKNIAETQEVTLVHKEKLSASMFLPPDGYQKQTLDLKKMMQEQGEEQNTADSSGNH